MIYCGLLSLLLAEYAANQKCSAVLLCSADSVYPKDLRNDSTRPIGELEISGGVLSTVDMLVQRCDNDDDVDDIVSPSFSRPAFCAPPRGDDEDRNFTCPNFAATVTLNILCLPVK